MKIIILGAGTAGLISALMLRERYSYYDITVVKSGEIGIVGVGEGSTEHWTRFLDYCGISVPEMIAETDATFKIGILFKNWKTINSTYVHSLDQQIPISSLNKLDVFGLSYCTNNDSLLPLAPVFENIFLKDRVVWTGFDKVYVSQFHFDTFKLNEYLQKKCKEKEIKIIDLTIDDVILDDNEHIIGLSGQDKILYGDFFVDCSGFHRFLSKKLDIGWVDYAKFLPMNHAIAFPTELKGKTIPPYTLSQAMSSGWSWRIPTQNRMGNGYVFNDNFIDSERALEEFNRVFKTKIKEPARDIKFRAGRIEKFWHQNVLSVGLSGSFAEPLEAQSIGFTIVQMFQLFQVFDGHKNCEFATKLYNERMNKCFDNIVDYLQLHYFGQRTDSDFWLDSGIEITDFNKQTISAINEGIINNGWFEEYFMFTAANWFQVCAGLDLIDKEQFMSNYTQHKYQYLTNIRDKMIEFLNSHKNLNTVDHRTMLDNIRNYYEQGKK